MAFTKIVGAGIHTLSNVHTHNVNSSGIITATSFVGPFNGSDGDFSGDVTIDGNLTVNGTTTTLDTNLTEVDKLEVSANNVTVGVAITQSGTGDILNLYDGSNKEFSVADGGTVKISQSMAFQQSDRVTTAGLLGRGSLLLAGTQQTDFAIRSNPHNSNLILGVGVTERLRIASDGSVGIGSANPQFKLDVFGNIRMHRTTAGGGFMMQTSVDDATDSHLNFRKARGGTGTLTTVQDDDDLATINAQGYSAAAGDFKTAARIHFEVDEEPDTSGDTSDMPGRILFETCPNGSAAPRERLRINSGGLVGIGTNNPQTTLEVVGTGVSFFTEDKNKHVDLTAGKIELVRNDSIAYIDFKTTNAEDYDCRIQQVDNGLKFYTGGQGSSTEKLQITSTGEIRIANGGLLTIKTDAAATYGISEALRIDDNNLTDDRALQIFEYQNSGARWFSFNQNLNVTTNGSAYTYTQGNYGGSNMIQMDSGDLRIYNDPSIVSGGTSAITPTETVRILSNGNVGINSTSPANKLDVALGAAWIYPDEDGTEAIALKLGKLKDYNSPLNEILVADNDGSSSPTYRVTSKINRYIAKWYFDRSDPTGRLNVFQLKSEASGGNLGNSFIIRDLKNTADSIKLWSNGDSFIGVTTDGTSRNLGIGTDTPYTTGAVSKHKLTIAGDDVLGIGRANTDMFYVRREYTAGKYTLQTINGGNDGSFLLQPYGGRVGIGTNNPTYTLGIVSENNLGISLINDTEFATAGVYLEGSRNAGTGTVGELHFYNRRNGGVDSKIKVNGDGNFTFNQNVGIGTNDPSQERLRVHKDGLDQILQRWGGSLGSTAGQRFMELYTPATDNGNDYFRFQTGNAFKFRIDTTDALCINAAGLVGIGTDNPSHELDIESVSPVIEMKDNDAGDSRFQIAQSGAQTYLDMDVGNLGSSSLRFRFAGQERVRLTSAGKVGIGTNNPLAPVDILATPIDTATLNTTNCLQLGLWVRAKSPSNTTGNIYTGITLGEGRAGLYAYDDGGGAAHGMGFWTGSNSGVSERLRITSTGTVGVNCTPTAAPLEVKQLSADGGALRLRDASATYRYLEFDVTGATSTITARSNNSHGNIDIGTLDQFGRTTQLYIKGGQTAAVGIGTNDPGVTFDVHGTSQVRDTSGNQNFFVSESGFRFSQSPSGWTNMDYASSPVIAWDYKSGPGDLFYIGSGGNTPIADQMAIVVSEVHGIKIGKSGYDGTDFDISSSNEFFRVSTGGKVGINQSTPDTMLHLSGDPASNGAIIRLENPTGMGQDELVGAVEFEKQDASGAGAGLCGGMRCHSDDSYGARTYLAFSTRGNSTGAAAVDTERFRITAQGGVTFNGDTAYANALNDYEEGSYTPTATVGSGSITGTTSFILRYVKIGRSVQIFGRLHFNTSASDLSSFELSLPFANDSGNKHDTSSIMHVIRGNGGDPVQGIRIFRVEGGSSVMKMQNHEGQVYGDLGTTSPHINVNFSYFSV